MLAYVFWHWPKSGVSRNRYERTLVQFYQKLNRNRPTGFFHCFGFRIPNFPWNAPAQHGCEDWYLVKNFKSLGVLNEAAVASEFRRTHNRIAILAKGGSGGVYRLYGKRLTSKTRFSVWLTKPEGTSYTDMISSLEKRGVFCHWRRQLTLGPAQEFCAHIDRPIVFPKEFSPVSVRVAELAEA